MEERARAAEVPVSVHHGGDARVDALLRAMEIAGKRRPLPVTLDLLCAEAKRVVSADVVSAYVRERRGGRDVLAMRGNLGLAAGATSFVTLEMGEGITGFAAEHGRPVSAHVSSGSAPFKPIPGIGEERFPTYLAVPLRGEGGTIGVLVLQRRGQTAFDRTEVMVATAMAGSFAHAIQRAVRASSGRGALRSRGVRVSGVGVVGGAAVGLAQVVPTLDDVGPAVDERTAADVERVFDTLASDVERSSRRVGTREAAEVELLLQDRRLKSALVDAARGEGTRRGLAAVARSYAQAPETARGPDERLFLSRRAREVEDLCALIAAALTGTLFRVAGPVLLVAEVPTRIVALVALSRRLSAVAIGSQAGGDEPALALLRAAKLPIVAELADLFTWAKPMDRVLVDGDLGTLRVHPMPSEIVRLRRRGRSQLACEPERDDG